ncbi:MAG: hypothetical protein R3A50_13130 [Saprospiraceae bacterium]
MESSKRLQALCLWHHYLPAFGLRTGISGNVPDNDCVKKYANF